RRVAGSLDDVQAKGAGIDRVALAQRVDRAELDRLVRRIAQLAWVNEYLRAERGADGRGRASVILMRVCEDDALDRCDPEMGQGAHHPPATIIRSGIDQERRGRAGDVDVGCLAAGVGHVWDTNANEIWPQPLAAAFLADHCSSFPIASADHRRAPR